MTLPSGQALSCARLFVQRHVIAEQACTSRTNIRILFTAYVIHTNVSLFPWGIPELYSCGGCSFPSLLPVSWAVAAIFVELFHM